ncbi:hypothetical protein IQ247_29210 [Plectonema cf. radiosum LEGE 06105]|uniref:Uncharacterized protein n=1 Tax=Plectonema cf. radiosum LEGE 06105 TaxID=945769 RepID=A0A8J7F8U1_9CYAN|nr:hypothetical protein [Plectonema radiosum]MBE9216692.1 hypothetical protein [Plectonema cf. radiosum LEGE 06105]
MSKQYSVINRFILVSYFTFFLFDLSPVIASEIKQSVKQIPQGVATGHNSQNIPKIELSPGYGVNISFIKSGEIVEKVWLDNPAIATLDVDGCLSTEGRKCEQEGATVIHLRRINPLKVPQLPNSNTSLLTVIAKGKSARKVYLFKVGIESKTPTYHTLEIIPDSKITLEDTQFSNITNINELRQISKGLKIVNTRGLISRESRLWSRIANFLIEVRMGEPVNTAARKSGISMRLVNRLIEIGSNSVMR